MAFKWKIIWSSHHNQHARDVSTTQQRQWEIWSAVFQSMTFKYNPKQVELEGSFKFVLGFYVKLYLQMHSHSCSSVWLPINTHRFTMLNFYFQLKNFMKTYDGVASASFSRAVETVEANVRWKRLYQDELFQWLGKAMRH